MGLLFFWMAIQLRFFSQKGWKLTIEAGQKSDDLHYFAALGERAEGLIYSCGNADNNCNGINGGDR